MEKYDFIQENQENGLREHLTVLFKHKRKILAVFVTVLATAAAAAFLMTPIYKADSSLLVKIGREYLNRPEVGENTPAMALSQEEINNSEIQILTNRDLAEKVISSVKMETIYPKLRETTPKNMNPMDAAVEIFRKNLKVEGVRKSGVIHISFRHKDPHVAAAALNRLVELYKEKHLQVFSDPKSSFLEMQLSEYGQKLKDSENSLQAFKQKTGVYSLEEQRSLLLHQRGELETSLMITQNSISELQKKLASLKANMDSLTRNKTLFTNTEREKIIVDAKSKLLALQLEELELLKKYAPTNRLVVNVRKELQTVRDFLKEQESDIAGKVMTGNQVYQNTEIERIKAETELNAQKAKYVVLSRQVAILDGKIRSLDFSEKDIQKLKRDQAINEKNYQTYTEKSEEARITDDMNRLKMANISVIQNASVPAEPVRPKKLLMILLGFIGGTVGGLGLAFWAESASQSFSTPEKVEKRLCLPVLAVIANREG